MIDILIAFVGEAMSKSVVFEWISKRTKTFKQLGLGLHGFKCFRAFVNPMKHSHLFLKYYLKERKDSLKIRHVIAI